MDFFVENPIKSKELRKEELINTLINLHREGKKLEESFEIGRKSVQKRVKNALEELEKLSKE